MVTRTIKQILKLIVVYEAFYIFLIEEIVYLNDNEDSLFSVAQKCLLSDTRMVFWDYISGNTFSI